MQLFLDVNTIVSIIQQGVIYFVGVNIIEGISKLLLDGDAMRNAFVRMGVILFYVYIVTGCAAVQNPFTSDKTFAGISPPSMHRKDDAGRFKVKMRGVDETKILNAEAKPFVDYYNALEYAANPPSGSDQQAAIDDYVRKGITVVNISCSRWFNSLAESQSRLAFTQNNQNVIQNLGTTLLGFGKATSATVGSFGAIFAGLNGIQDSFSQSFLLAPNANKVKEHIFTALDQQAAELTTTAEPGVPGSERRRTATKPMTFTAAYMALEKYADICTQQTSKEIVNSALDQTTTQIQAGRGNKIITASAQSEDTRNTQVEIVQAILAVQQALQEAKGDASKIKAINERLDEIAKRAIRPVSSNESNLTESTQSSSTGVVTIPSPTPVISGSKPEIKN